MLATQFKSYLQTSIGAIQNALNTFEQSAEQELNAVAPLLLHLAKTFNEANIGGKRLRAVLVKLGYELTQQMAHEDVIKVALAFEVFQTAILIHDDIIDQSPLRRGKPTVHKLLAAQHGTYHYGVAQGICLGDIGMFWAMRLVGESNFPDSVRIKAVNSFLNTILYTGIGELLDVELSMQKQVQATENEVIKIYLHKTAHYTITGALQLGAILGNGSEELLAGLKEYGDNLGIAFQIHDDILGVFGDEAETGKSASSDIEEGKITLLSIFAQEHAKDSEKQFLKEYYGSGVLTTEELAMVRQVFVSTSALAYAEKVRENYLQKALAAIAKLPISTTHQELLQSIAYLMVERKS
jgi:geranylgeranyl pyrophosphate synthase